MGRGYLVLETFRGTIDADATAAAATLLAGNEHASLLAKGGEEVAAGERAKAGKHAKVQVVVYQLVLGVELAVEVTVYVVVPHGVLSGDEILGAHEALVVHQRGHGYHHIRRTATIQGQVDDKILHLRVVGGLLECVEEDGHGVFG